MTETQPIDRSSAEDTSVPVHVRWARVMGDLNLVAKAGKYKDSTGTQYNFRGVDDVVNAAGPLVRRHGLTIRPELISVSYEMVTRSGGKPARACQVVVKYVATGPAGDEYVIAVMPGESFDTGDKAVGKATSVAWRIALSQGLTLPTGETDPDATRIELGNERARGSSSDGGGKPDPEWRDGLLAKIRGTSSIPQLQNFWRMSANGVRNGKISEAEAIKLQQEIQQRTGELNAAEKPAPAQPSAQRANPPAAPQQPFDDAADQAWLNGASVPVNGQPS